MVEWSRMAMVGMWYIIFVNDHPVELAEHAVVPNVLVAVLTSDRFAKNFSILEALFPPISPPRSLPYFLRFLIYPWFLSFFLHVFIGASSRPIHVWRSTFCVAVDPPSTLALTPSALLSSVPQCPPWFPCSLPSSLIISFTLRGKISRTMRIGFFISILISYCLEILRWYSEEVDGVIVSQNERELHDRRARPSPCLLAHRLHRCHCPLYSSVPFTFVSLVLSFFTFSFPLTIFVCLIRRLGFPFLPPFHSVSSLLFSSLFFLPPSLPFLDWLLFLLHLDDVDWANDNATTCLTLAFSLLSIPFDLLPEEGRDKFILSYIRLAAEICEKIGLLLLFLSVCHLFSPYFLPLFFFFFCPC